MEVPEGTSAFWLEARNSMSQLLEAAQKRYCEVTFQEWLARYPPGKSQRLMPHGEVVGPGDGVVTPFNKREKVMKGFDLVDPYDEYDPSGNFDAFDPRVISQRTDAYQARVGPYCLSVSDALARTCGTRDNVTYACGLTLAGLGAWMGNCLERFGDNCEFIVSDFSRFDAHLTAPALCAQYRMMAFVTRSMCRELFGDLATSASYRSGLKYSVRGTRKSGNSDTSVGNSLLSIAYWMVAIKTSSVDVFKLIVMGDDAVVALPRGTARCVLSAKPEVGASGILADCRIVEDWRHVTFCSCRFFRVGDHYRAAGKPGRTLVKGGFALDAPRGRYWKRWLDGLARSLALEYWHVPVMRALALAMVRARAGGCGYDDMLAKAFGLAPCEEGHFWAGKSDHDVELFSFGSRGSHRMAHVTGSAALDDFALAYDISVDDVVRVEQWLLDLPLVLPLRLDHPILEVIVRADV
jgi:hypothetical protein